MYTLEEFYKDGIISVKATNIPRIDIFKTFDCGQCFRFDPVSLFGNKYEFGGVAFGRYVVFAQNCATEIIVYGSDKADFIKIWAPFLSLDTDYEKIDSHIIKTVNSEHMTKATNYSYGIRILRQDAWEALCSFIISQNNNIPRIKKIIASLCKKYGDVVEFNGNTHYSFPSAKVLMDAGIDEIFALKTGFRAKYIHDAAVRVANGDILLENVKSLCFDDALNELCKIKGVGLKVASCALLFGFEKTEAFPIDVWMRRALDNHFGGSIDLVALGATAGIAQQYLFYYEKYNQTLD